MGNMDLITAVQSDDLEAVRDLLKSDVDVNEQDEQGWAALNYAAGKGNLTLVKMLVENGADVLKMDKNQRTPYSIALAAGRSDVAAYLRDVKDAITGGKSPTGPRKYCKAYYLRHLRKYVDWSESRINWKGIRDNDPDGKDLTNESIIFIHQDYTVTRSMWHDEDVIFNQTTSDWKDFCERELGFKVPDDLDLIASVSTT
ncbi:MAG: ankyrin repeat domain-containing protein [Blastocatellia bacterium]